MAEYIDRERLLRKFNVDDMTNLADGNLILLREARKIISDFPAADVAPVVHGKPTTEMRTVLLAGYHEELGVTADDGTTLYRKRMTHTNIPSDHCSVCGATLCSRWHNYCGKCGARMDGDGDG